MTEDSDQWKIELLQSTVRHGKTVWDAIEFFCALVSEDQITHRQRNEILRYALKKGRRSIAIALGKVLELRKE